MGTFLLEQASINLQTNQHHLDKMKAFIAAVMCLAVVPAIASSANIMRDDDSAYPPTGNPLEVFSYCTGMESDGNPLALPQCIITSLVYGQCCTGLPCAEDTGNEGICELMYNFGNTMLEQFLAGQVEEKRRK